MISLIEVKQMTTEVTKVECDECESQAYIYLDLTVDIVYLCWAHLCIMSELLDNYIKKESKD